MAIGLAVIVVLLKAGAFGIVDRENGIERRPKLARKDGEVVSLAFFRSEFEEIDVALFLDDAVEGDRQWSAPQSVAWLDVVIGLGFEDVGKGDTRMRFGIGAGCSSLAKT